MNNKRMSPVLAPDPGALCRRSTVVCHQSHFTMSDVKQAVEATVERVAQIEGDLAAARENVKELPAILKRAREDVTKALGEEWVQFFQAKRSEFYGTVSNDAKRRIIEEVWARVSPLLCSQGLVQANPDDKYITATLPGRTMPQGLCHLGSKAWFSVHIETADMFIGQGSDVDARRFGNILDYMSVREISSALWLHDLASANYAELSKALTEQEFKKRKKAFSAEANKAYDDEEEADESASSSESD